MKLTQKYHTICVYSPFILVNVLIIFVVTTYSFNYLSHFILWYSNPFSLQIHSNDIVDSVIQSLFLYTIIPNYIYIIGFIYAVMFYLCFILFVASLYCAFLSNPGYLPVPTEHEAVFVQDNNTYNKNKKGNNKILLIFNKITNDGPLSSTEVKSLKKDIMTYINDKNNKSSKEIVNVVNGDDVILCSCCLRMKPERAHHCRKCDKCILRMDHHCPWLCNCIGQYNYKSFLLTISYGFSVTMSICISYSEYIIKLLMKAESCSMIFGIWNVFAYFCNLVLFGFAFYLVIVNYSLAMKNMTVIEKAEYDRFINGNNGLNKEGTIINKGKHRYDKGFVENMKEIFGENKLMWFFPEVW